MIFNASNRAFVAAVFAVAVAALSAVVWRYGYSQALDQLEQRGRADLALASDRLSAQLQRYQELTVLLADHPVFEQIEGLERSEDAQTVLQVAADKTGAPEVLFVDRQARVLVVAGADARRAVGNRIDSNKAFRRAMQGALGTDHVIADAQNRRTYSFAAPTFDALGKVSGAVVVAVDVRGIEWDWSGSNPPVFFTDQTGQVFISNRSELLYLTRPASNEVLAPPEGKPAIDQHSMSGGKQIWNMDWGPYLPAQSLHLTRDLPVIGMRGEALIDVDPAKRLAGLQAAAVAALCLAFGAILFVLTERRRTLAEANAVLETRVSERTEALSETNKQLRREVAERKEAEAALKKAQAELVQAGKLSALGHMSAGISHELNQPLMAIRSYAENGVQFLDQGRSEVARENLGKIGDLARRMARIIRNLRAFAKQESEPATTVDVGQVIESALELTQVRCAADGIAVHWTPPKTPQYAMAGEVRLGQVVLNLIVNAADAMAARDATQYPRDLTIELAENGTQVIIRVADTGPGISEPDRIFDPFYSTKEVGASEGMGLGLSISYGLIQSFGGAITGRNRDTGGAEFEVELTGADLSKSKDKAA